MASNPVAPPAPPPPPPPPPLFPASKEPNNHGLPEDKNKVGEIETKELDEGTFIAQVSDLVKTTLIPEDQTCERGNVITLVIALPLRRAILQNGPMCGLVALAEAFELLGKQREPVCPYKLLEAAKDAGLTKQGEMFSVKGMKSLAEMFGASHTSEILHLIEEDKTTENFQTIVRNLVMGLPVLFPYDADYNHSPSLRNGHAAHWAVVHGIACHVSQEEVKALHEQPDVLKVLESTSDLVIVRPMFQSSSPYSQVINEENVVNKLIRLFNFDSSYVIAHQGKSFRTALWNFSDLYRSNQNLKQVAPKIRDTQINFICEDIVDGLCSKVLLLE